MKITKETAMNLWILANHLDGDEARLQRFAQLAIDAALAAQPATVPEGWSARTAEWLLNPDNGVVYKLPMGMQNGLRALLAAAAKPEQQEAPEEIHPALVTIAGGLKIPAEQMRRDMANAPIYHKQGAPVKNGCQLGVAPVVCDDCEHWKPVRMRGES